MSGRADDTLLLEWQVEIGADECTGEMPVDRFTVAAEPMPEPSMPTGTPATGPARNPALDLDGNPAREPAGNPAPGPSRSPAAGPAVRQKDPIAATIAIAEREAGRALTLDALRDAIAAYEHCEVRKMATNLVFADGNPQARVMIVGEAPGADEDRLGKPFVGRAGQLLDAMFAEIGLDREAAEPERSLYISNILPWRPPGNRNPTRQEIGMMLPFVRRHVELAGPDILILMGNISCDALLGKQGITRLRGNWHAWKDIPVMPMFHPAYLLRNPVAKRDAWIDLLLIRRRLADGGIR